MPFKRGAPGSRRRRIRFCPCSNPRIFRGVLNVKSVTLGSVAVGIVAWLVCLGSTGLAQSIPSPKPFLVFDGTLYSNKPDLSAYGIQPITLAYAGQFGADWNKTADRLPDLPAVQAVAREAQLKGHGVVLDIEHWPLTGSLDAVHDSLTKYMTVLNWFRAAAPGLPVGYYGAPPVRDYWRAITDTSSQERKSWMAENDQLRALAYAVDILFPSLYTLYPDHAGWRKYAIAQIEEARRYGGGKPVYVFLWPQYHESNLTLGGRYLEADYWLLELETAKEYADGIVIWGGWGSDNRPAKWDDSAPWWNITKEFMKRGNLSPPLAPSGLSIIQ